MWALEKNRHLDQARRCYRLAARGLTKASSHRRLAHSYRRTGEGAEACAIWLEMIRLGEGWIEPYVELAKYYEHTARDLDAALEVAITARPFAKWLNRHFVHRRLSQKRKMRYNTGMRA